MYTLHLTNSAEKDLRKLPRPILERLNAKILTLRNDPRPAGAIRLSGNQEGWRARWRLSHHLPDR